MGLKAQRRSKRLVVYAVLLAGLVFVVFPYWSMFTTSLRPQTYTFETVPRLWPEETTSRNYVDALNQANVGRFFLNSMVVATATTVITVLVASLLAYAFARLEFPFKEPLFMLFLFGAMIPPVMLIIPQFMVAKQLALLDKLAGLVVVYVTMNISMQTFLLRGFFEDIPRDLEEAALLDGAGRWDIFWRLVLPLSKPGLSVVAIFTFIYGFTEFPWAHVAVRKTMQRTLPVGIMLFQQDHLTRWGLVFAASIMATIPIFIVFLIFQKHFIRGISTTGMKG